MANRILGITVDIEGKTSGLTQSLKEANSAISKTTTALRDVDKALALDPTNVELLAQKEALLTKQIEQTNDKLEIMKKVATDANDALARGDISEEQYASLTAEIVKTENALDKLETEANQSGDALEETGDDAKEAGDKASTGSEGFEKFANAAKVAAEVAAAAMAAALAAVVEVTKALTDCTVEAAAYADEMYTLSSTTGLSVETLQELSYASELLDVNVETVAGALKKCTKSMADAQDGSGAAAEAYEQLGISVTDANGELRDNEDVFWEAVDALGQIENETERDALAMQIFGKSANELNPLIEAGSEQFKEYADQASEAGAVLSEDVLDDFAEFDDQLQMLDGGAKAAKNALGTILLPVLSSLAGEGIDLLAEFTNGVLDANGDMSKIGDLIGELLPQAIDAIMEQLPVVLELGLSIISALGEGLMNNIDLILTTAADILLQLCQGILSALPEVVSVAIDIIFKLIDTLLNAENIQLLTQAAIDVLITLCNGISDHISDVISTAIMIVNTIQTTLINNADELLPAAIELIVALAFAILDNLDDIISAAISVVAALVGAIVENAPLLIPEAVDAIMSKFSEMGDGLAKDALTWGADLVASFIDGIMNNISDLTNTVDYVAGLVDDYLGFSVPSKGRLSDFDKSGGDMVDLFASSMEAKESDLERALFNTANVIGSGWESNMASQSMVGGTTDIGGGLSRIEKALGNIAPSGGGTWVFPIYIGNEPVDTLVVDAIDRYNYQTGGH